MEEPRTDSGRSKLLPWQKEILDQRLKDAELHPEHWVSWDAARQRLKRQLRGQE